MLTSFIEHPFIDNLLTNANIQYEQPSQKASNGRLLSLDTYLNRLITSSS
jgi:hypothetical protein